MYLLDKVIPVTSKSDIIKIYPIGDVHAGAYNFAEKSFKQHVAMIASEPNAYWIGGGDICDAIILQDQKRFDIGNFPDWMLSGGSKNIRSKTKDILKAQMEYVLGLLDPIKNKCMGLIEGNHEYTISHRHNRDITSELCSILNVPNLTDCAFVRLRFIRHVGGSSVVRMFICHGNGGGRTPGAEPAHLTRLAQDKECEIVLRGHSHTFHIIPPITRLTIPKGGKLTHHIMTHDVRAANWGAWLLNYAVGPSTYDSRALYPVRPLVTLSATIKPFRERNGMNNPYVSLNEIIL